ncbi:MAG: CD225/dispanin family protein [Muribaculaceae bacterium]|nr:CD225/dispanin family protein [Muribaculaceae bacterium]
MEKSYWIMSGDTRIGPMTLSELTARPDLTPETPVWCDGMADWSMAGDLPEIAAVWIVDIPDTTIPPIPERTPQPSMAVPHRFPDTPQPPSYLGWAIALMLLCCIPTGVVAIIYAAKVSPTWMRGDIDGAEKASEKAGIWCVITFIAGLIWAPFYMLYSILSM